MQKISGILSPSARVTSVDLEESQPSRPGSPNIGQKQGVVRINDRFNLSQQAKEMAAKETLVGGRNPKDAAGAKIVTEMSRNFFETRVKPQPAKSELILEGNPLQQNIKIPEMYVPETEEAEVGSSLSVEA